MPKIPTNEVMRLKAKAEFEEEGKIEFADEPEVSRDLFNHEKGTYVAAWVWVADPEEV
jgi:hypothetical protein